MLSVTRTILLSESGIAALKKLILVKRAERPHFSNSYIAKKVGLRSRSYLSDILNGRKKLSARYVSPIVDTLDLETCESTYLNKKLLLGTEFAKPAQIYAELSHEVELLGKNLSYESIAMTDVSDIYSLCLVYLCFYLNKERTLSSKEAIRKLPMIPARNVELALNKLLQKELVVRSEKGLTINPDQKVSLANGEASIEQEMDFLRTSMEEGKSHLHLFETSRDQVVFHSTLLTVKRKDYLQKLSEFKDQLRNLQTDLESHEADSLVRFNLQVYPLI